MTYCSRPVPPGPTVKGSGFGLGRRGFAGPNADLRRAWYWVGIRSLENITVILFPVDRTPPDLVGTGEWSERGCPPGSLGLGHSASLIPSLLPTIFSHFKSNPSCVPFISSLLRTFSSLGYS